MQAFNVTRQENGTIKIELIGTSTPAPQPLLALRQHIETNSAYLAALIYNHECNIAEPDFDQQNEYAVAVGAQKTLEQVAELLAANPAPDASITLPAADVPRLINHLFDSLNDDQRAAVRTALVAE